MGDSFTAGHGVARTQDRFANLVRSARPAWQIRLGAFWRDSGVPHLDLLTVYGNHKPSELVVGKFDAHPNERAHAIAAEAMLPFLDGVVGR